MDIQQNNVAVLHFNLVNQDGSTIFIRKTKLATFNLINPSEVSVPITDIGFDATLNQCWIRVPKESNATTGQYYGVLNIVDDDWGTYTTSKIKVYSVVSDADEDTKSVVFTATCIATQVTNPSGGNSPYYNTTTGTWWQYSDTLKAFEDTGVGNLIKYITKNVQHLKDGTGNGSVVTCLDDEISANNIATGLCSTDFGKNNDNRGESCVALGEHNYIAEGVSNAVAVSGAQPSAVDVFAVGDKTAGHINVFEINQFGDIYFRPDSSQERIVILQDILDSVIKNVVYDSSKYSLTVTFYSAADNANKTTTYDLSGLKAVLKDDAVKEISVNQATAVMTVDTINGSSKQIQLPITSLVQSDWSTTDTSADSYILNKPTALSSFTNDSGYDTVTSVDSKLASYLPLAGGTLTGNLLFSNSGTDTKGIYGTVGNDDYWRLIGGAPAIDSGWLEIATGDAGTEPIYVRQYMSIVGPPPYNHFGKLVRTATLLDAAGNTSFPGTVTASAFSGNASSATTATKLDGYYTTFHYDSPAAGGFYGHDCIPVIKSDGVMDVSKYIDFHASSTLLDFATRITCNSATGNEVSLPSSNGTLALTTDNVASATKLANARTITLSGDTTGTATFDGSNNITISTSTNCASEAKTLTTFGVARDGSTNSYGLIASLPLPYLYTNWNEITGSIYVSYNHHDANEKFGLIRLKASGMGGTDGNYGYYSALQLGNLDSSIVKFSYIAPTASASGSLNVYAYGNNDNFAGIIVTSITNNVSIYSGGYTTSSIPGVEFYLSDMYMPNVIPNRTNGALTITKNGTSVGAFNGSADTTIALTDTTSIQPFDLLDSNEKGTFWTQTNTNSIAVAFMTDSKVVTNKVRIFMYSTEGTPKIRCAIYKNISSEGSEVLSLVTQTQLYIGPLSNFIDIPFETVATLDSDTLYYFAVEYSSGDSAFLGKQINASLMSGFVYKGDAFNAGSDTFKSQYPTDGPVDGNVFIPYFKII